MSSIVTVCDTGVAALPAQSTAVHVLVTVPRPHASRFVASDELIVTFGSHASLTVGSVNAVVAGHSIVTSAPWPLRTGGVVSSMVTVCVTGAAAFPAQSTAVHVLITVPSPHATRFDTSDELIVQAQRLALAHRRGAVVRQPDRHADGQGPRGRARHREGGARLPAPGAPRPRARARDHAAELARSASRARSSSGRPLTRISRRRSSTGPRMSMPSMRPGSPSSR